MGSKGFFLVSPCGFVYLTETDEILGNYVQDA